MKRCVEILQHMEEKNGKGEVNTALSGGCI